MTVIEVDPYILDTLMPDLVGHDRQPSAFLVYLHLWRLSHGSGAPTVRIPLRELAAGTGLSKRAVQDAVTRLARRRLIEVAREGITAVALYRVLQPWRRK